MSGTTHGVIAGRTVSNVRRDSFVMAVTLVKQEVHFGWQHIKPKWGDIPGSGETNDCRRWLKHLDLTPKNEDAHSQPNVIFAFASRSDDSRSRLVQSRAVVRVKNYIKRLKRSRLCAIFQSLPDGSQPASRAVREHRQQEPDIPICFHAEVLARYGENH